jgi:hypothetical protein
MEFGDVNRFVVRRCRALWEGSGETLDKEVPRPRGYVSTGGTIDRYTRIGNSIDGRAAQISLHSGRVQH